MKHPFIFPYRFIFLAALLLVAGSVGAQATGNRLYGYSQAFIPGIKAARDLDEAGNWVKKQSPHTYQYFIYLTTPAPARMYPVEVWIKGEPFGARPENIAHTPVVHTNRSQPQHPQKQILVPKTTQKVIAIVPLPQAAGKTSTKAEKLARENELVVVYKQGGKMVYGVLKKFTSLDAATLQ